MKNNLINKSLAASAVLSAFARKALAQAGSVQSYTGHSGGTNWGSFKDIVYSIGTFMSTRLMPVLASVAVLWFIWNLGYFVRNMDNVKDREQFRQYAVNGTMGLSVLFLLWGIIAIATNTFFGWNPFIPQLPVR